MQQLNPTSKPGKPKLTRFLSTGVFFAIPFMAFLAFTALTAFNREIGDAFFCIGMIVAVGGTALLAIVVNVGIRRMLAVKVDELMVQASSPVRPGETFNVDLVQSVNRRVEVESIDVELYLEEWVRYRSGTDTITKTHKHVAARQSMPGGTYNSGGMIQQRFRFDLPADSMHTLIPDMAELDRKSDDGFSTPKTTDMDDDFMDKMARQVARQAPDTTEDETRQQLEQMPPAVRKVFKSVGPALFSRMGSTNNQLRWYLKIHIRMRQWIDYIQTFEVEVIPAVASEDEDYGFSSL